MPRAHRVDVAGYAYHVLNRSVGRRRIFHSEADYAAFERVLFEMVERSKAAVELLAYCLMPNHWHLVLRTTKDGALQRAMQWLTLTHTRRYRNSRKQEGYGPIYQGRYKSFVIEGDHHLLAVCRYAERNAARAGLVKHAEDWAFCSLARWHANHEHAAWLSPWPLPTRSCVRGRPRHWLATVNTPLSEPELTALRHSANRTRPYGSNAWQTAIIERFGLHSTTRNPGRPRKKRDKDVTRKVKS